MKFNIRFSEPGVSVALAIHASRGPGSLSLGR
jgi:hypothetical protein